jgi:hypothetical protein
MKVEHDDELGIRLGIGLFWVFVLFSVIYWILYATR